MGSEYPEVDALVSAVVDHQISFRRVDARPEIRRLFYNAVDMTVGSLEVSVPVMDEFKDLANGGAPVLLHLVLTEIVQYEEADDFLVWARDLGLDASDCTAREIWLMLREAAPLVRDALGHDIKPVGSFDMELNAGPAQALRAAGE